MTNVAAAGGALGTADQRREQMLRAALEVIADRGHADTRISDVAERIGISPALVIYYFKTKDQLLTDAIRYLDNLWYADGQRRMATLPTAAARLEEIVAMSCLPEEDTEPRSSWTLWLDFWALAARNPEVGVLRQRDDERWRDSQRDVQASVRGVETVRYSWRDVYARACETALLQAQILRRRGWRGTPKPCSAGCPVGRAFSRSSQRRGA